MSVTATVANADKLLAKLAKLPAELEAQIRLAMEAQAEEIVAMMRRLVPVDQGDLRDSIQWTWGEAPTGSMKIAAVQSSRSRGISITIFAGGNKAYYARWQEFGTVKMPANPFFYVAWRANRKKVKARIQAAMRTAARKVAAS